MTTEPWPERPAKRRKIGRYRMGKPMPAPRRMIGHELDPRIRTGRKSPLLNWELRQMYTHARLHLARYLDRKTR